MYLKVLLLLSTPRFPLSCILPASIPHVPSPFSALLQQVQITHIPQKAGFVAYIIRLLGRVHGPLLAILLYQPHKLLGFQRLT